LKAVVPDGEAVVGGEEFAWDACTFSAAGVGQSVLEAMPTPSARP